MLKIPHGCAWDGCRQRLVKTRSCALNMVRDGHDQPPLRFLHSLLTSLLVCIGHFV